MDTPCGDLDPELEPAEEESREAIENRFDLRQLLTRAMAQHSGRLSLFSIEGLLMDAARQNEKRPAYIKIATTDSVVKNLYGDPRFLDSYLMVRIPRDVVDELNEPKSLIHRPQIILTDG